ncbi:class I SAM-dependent methyltransferase [Nanoarchaeota archaeon]
MTDDSYYDQISEGYEELHKEEQLAKMKLVKSQIGLYLAQKARLLTDGKIKIADIGCGTGITADWTKEAEIFKKMYNLDLIVTGLDPARKLLDKCKLPIDKVLAAAEKIPLPDKSFDIVTSITAIQNFQDIKKGLSEISRIGKEDALFVLSFLKKSPKKDLILSEIRSIFKVKRELEEDKDILIIAIKL